ncbi:MAG: gamma-butyrobetaine hydroxylase-like domain-containing protein [Burkholderiales bacterium]
MAGLDKGTPTPTQIVVHARSRVLELGFSDGASFRLPFELLRVYSPSAEVRGHGPGQEVLQVGKREVGVTAVEPVGHYAIQPHFDDGHATGIFSWDYLHWLGTHQDRLWQEYLDRLQAAGASRDPVPPPGAAPAPGPAPAAAGAIQATALSRPRS